MKKRLLCGSVRIALCKNRNSNQIGKINMLNKIHSFNNGPLSCIPVISIFNHCVKITSKKRLCVSFYVLLTLGV